MRVYACTISWFIVGYTGSTYNYNNPPVWPEQYTFECRPHYIVGDSRPHRKSK